MSWGGRASHATHHIGIAGYWFRMPWSFPPPFTPPYHLRQQPPAFHLRLYLSYQTTPHPRQALHMHAHSVLLKIGVQRRRGQARVGGLGVSLLVFGSHLASLASPPPPRVLRFFCLRFSATSYSLLVTWACFFLYLPSSVAVHWDASSCTLPCSVVGRRLACILYCMDSKHSVQNASPSIGKKRLLAKGRVHRCGMSALSL